MSFNNVTLDAYNDNLIHVYQLGESSGTRHDKKGSDDLTDNNSVGSAAGKHGDCADFSGANSLRDTDFTFPAAGNPYSISGWISIDAYPASWGQLWAVDGGSSAKNVGLNIQSNGKIRHNSFDGASNYYVESTSTLTTSTFYHVLETFDGSDLRLFINGVENGTATSATVNYDASKHFVIGQTYYNRDPVIYYDGKVDEVYIWDAALTAGCATALYNSATGTFYINDASNTNTVAFSEGDAKDEDLADSSTLEFSSGYAFYYPESASSTVAYSADYELSEVLADSSTFELSATDEIEGEIDGDSTISYSCSYQISEELIDGNSTVEYSSSYLQRSYRELYGKSNINVDSIGWNLNAPSTMSFRQLVKYDSADALDLNEWVMYEDPDAGCLFRGKIVSRRKVGRTDGEHIAYEARDPIRILQRQIFWDENNESLITYNPEGAEASGALTVKEVLTQICSAAVTARPEDFDGYTMPATSSTATVTLPAMTQRGETYKAWLDAVLEYAPTWAYRCEYGQSGTTTLTFIDLETGAASASVSIGTGVDSDLTSTPNVIYLEESENINSKFRYLKIEGRGEFEEQIRVTLTPAWDAGTGPDEKYYIWYLDYEPATFRMFPNPSTDKFEACEYMPSITLNKIGVRTFTKWLSQEEVEYGKLNYDDPTMIFTKKFEGYASMWTTATASQYQVSYVAKTADFIKTQTSTATAMDGERHEYYEDFYKYTYESSTGSVVVYDATDLANEVLAAKAKLYLEEEKSAAVGIFKYSDVLYRPGYIITNLDNRRVMSVTITPESKTVTMNLSDTLAMMPETQILRGRVAEKGSAPQRGYTGQWFSTKKEDDRLKPIRPSRNPYRAAGGGPEASDPPRQKTVVESTEGTLGIAQADIAAAATGNVKYAYLDTGGTPVEYGDAFPATNVGKVDVGEDDAVALHTDKNGGFFFY